MLPRSPLPIVVLPLAPGRAIALLNLFPREFRGEEPLSGTLESLAAESHGSPHSAMGSSTRCYSTKESLEMSSWLRTKRYRPSQMTLETFSMPNKATQLAHRRDAV